MAVVLVAAIAYNVALALYGGLPAQRTPREASGAASRKSAMNTTFQTLIMQHMEYSQRLVNGSCAGTAKKGGAFS